MTVVLRRSRTVAAVFAAAVLASSSLPPNAAAVSVSRHHLIVSAMGSPAVGVLGVGHDGALSRVPGAPFPGAPASLALAITPDARHVYSAHLAPGTIIGDRIEADGSLTPEPGGTVVAGLPVEGLAITPDGTRLFATIGLGAGLGSAIRSYAISASGALTPTGAPDTPVPGLSTISLPAIAPDGRHLVATGYLGDTVSSFAIGPDAKLTPVNTVASGHEPVMPVFTPNGRYLYVSDEGGDTVSGYVMGSDGRLTPAPGSPYHAVSTPHGVAISPDGGQLYVAGAGTNAVAGFRIGADGALVPNGAPVTGPGSVGRVVLSPDGQTLYAIEALGGLVGDPAIPVPPLPPLPGINLSSPHLTSKVVGYPVRADGTLGPAGPPEDTGVVYTDGTTAFVTPNLGPVAHLDAAESAGSERVFSAGNSRDPDGSIARYDWDFGDGQYAITTTARVTHTYSGTESHTVTVTVTDDEGCSKTLVYNGTTVVCGGGLQAQAHITA